MDILEPWDSRECDILVGCTTYRVDEVLVAGWEAGENGFQYLSLTFNDTNPRDFKDGSALLGDHIEGRRTLESLHRQLREVQPWELTGQNGKSTSIRVLDAEVYCLDYVIDFFPHIVIVDLQVIAVVMAVDSPIDITWVDVPIIGRQVAVQFRDW